MSERILITQVQRDTEKNHAHLYGRGHQWPDLRLFDLTDLLAVDIDAANLEPGKLTPCRFWAHYTLSEKLNSAGNPYRDVITLEPVTAPASSTSTDTSAIVTELRQIRAMLSSALGAEGFTFETHSKLDPNHAEEPQPDPPQPDPPTDAEADHIVNACTTDAEADHIVNACTTDPDTDPETGEVPGPVVLLYGDGSLVSDNPHENDAYREFVAAQNEIPANLDALRNWSRIAHADTDSA